MTLTKIQSILSSEIVNYALNPRSCRNESLRVAVIS